LLFVDEELRDVDTLLARAAAMYRPRRKAATVFQFHAAGMNAPAPEAAVLQGELSAAL